MKNRKKIPSARRRRPQYPKLTLWQSVLVARPECGVNKPIRTAKDREKIKILRGVFILSRLQLRPSRSRYEPHAGKKQAAKKGRNP